MNNRSDTSADNAVGGWDPLKILPRVSEKDIRSSGGFLRCQPGQWFPGLPVQWLAMAHGLGLELKVTGIAPSLAVSGRINKCYGAKVGEHEVAVGAEEDSFLLILNAIVPGGAPAGQGVLEEYLVRRLFATLIMSWAGPELGAFVFSGKKEVSDLDVSGSINISLSINGMPAVVSVLLSAGLIEIMDGMWRRQLRSSSVDRKSVTGFDLDIAHLAVTPTSLSEYTSPGTIVDLETPLTDHIILKLNTGELLIGKLRTMGEEFVIEVGVGSPPPLNQPEGTSRVAVRIGSIKIPPNRDATEMLQPGSMIQTGLPVSDVAALVVGAERIGRIKLCTYEQRFAMTVL